VAELVDALASGASVTFLVYQPLLLSCTANARIMFGMTATVLPARVESQY